MAGRTVGALPALVALAMMLATSACSGVAPEREVAAASVTVRVETTTSTAPIPTSTTSTAAPTTTAPPPPPRSVVEGALGTPFATVAGITLVHPAARIERVGFHQSNHEGARQLDPAASAVGAITLDARDRLTGDRTAADIVVDPTSEVRAPVTGTVKRAGGYTLYCRYSDDFVVIAPDAAPEWEVKLLHISGVAVRAGDRVVAGETLLAPRATPLPFASQVDDHTADPAWPHVHVEVVDPAIRNVPSPGGGC